MAGAAFSILALSVGGAIGDAKGFSFTCDVFALVALTFAVSYLVVVVIPTYFCQRQKEKNESVEL